MDKELMDLLTIMNQKMEKGFADVKEQLSEVNRKLDILERRLTRGFDETATFSRYRVPGSH